MFDFYLSFLDDDIIEDILHLAGRSEFLQLGPESNPAFLKQLHGHFILEGNNWKRPGLLKLLWG